MVPELVFLLITTTKYVYLSPVVSLFIADADRHRLPAVTRVNAEVRALPHLGI
jgi:hypothetical protein